VIVGNLPYVLVQIIDDKSQFLIYYKIIIQQLTRLILIKFLLKKYAAISWYIPKTNFKFLT
jgi:hypothetical protein